MKRLAPLVGICLAACASSTQNAPSNVSTAPAPMETVTYAPLGAACGGLERSEELVCRSELRISRARDSGDPAVLACYLTKSSELQATYRFAAATRDDANASGEDAAISRERLEAATKTMERQYAALDDCLHVAASRPDSLEVAKPAANG